tara:strand:- start:2632 stop:2805 length:174 start_codon:yes stop_codon:yes gene_type:complete
MIDELDNAIFEAMKEKGLIPDKPVGIARSSDALKLIKCNNVPRKRLKRGKLKTINKR